MTTIINYDAIVQELEKGLTHVSDPSNACRRIMETLEPHQILKEFYTVGMGLPRQLGASYFVLKEMIKRPAATCVVTSEVYIDCQIQKLKNMLVAAKENSKVDILGVPYLELTPEIKESLLSQPNIVEDMRKRFITIRGLLKLMSEEGKFVDGMDRVYIDGGLYTFTKIKLKKYYEWLYKHSESQIQTWIIN